MLDEGKDLGVPDGVLMNGKGPYRYNATLVPRGIDHETINVESGDHLTILGTILCIYNIYIYMIGNQNKCSCFGILIYIGKTYRFRVHNVGTSTSLNFRIQSHNLLLVETEGAYTVQQIYSNLDIHVGQSYSFLVTMDQNASSDFYIVASARFTNGSLWDRVTGVAILHYANSRGKASGPLPDPPNDFYYKGFSMNQAKSIRFIVVQLLKLISSYLLVDSVACNLTLSKFICSRTNLTTGAARPNPQGSYKYGTINVTHVYVLKNTPLQIINGKLRATINGISYSPPTTPLRLADEYNKTGVYTLDFPSVPGDKPPRIGSSVINGTYKGFIEIIFQNNDTRIQTYHMDGHAFYVVG